MEVGRDDLLSLGLLVYGSPFTLACVFCWGHVPGPRTQILSKEQFLVLRDPTVVKVEDPGSTQSTGSLNVLVKELWMWDPWPTEQQGLWYSWGLESGLAMQPSGHLAFL